MDYSDYESRVFEKMIKYRRDRVNEITLPKGWDKEKLHENINLCLNAYYEVKVDKELECLVKKNHVESYKKSLLLRESKLKKDLAEIDKITKTTDIGKELMKEIFKIEIKKEEKEILNKKTIFIPY